MFGLKYFFFYCWLNRNLKPLLSFLLRFWMFLFTKRANFSKQSATTMMIRTAVKLTRAAATVARTSTKLRPSLLARSPPSRLLHDGINGSNANPVALQMINYALSVARSQKSGSSTTLVLNSPFLFLENKFQFNLILVKCR